MGTCQVLKDHLAAKVYEAKNVHLWSSEIVMKVLKNLNKQAKPFKYVGMQPTSDALVGPI